MHDLPSFLLEHESTIRMASFLILLFLLMALETIRPRRLTEKNYTRKLNNLSLQIINTVVLRLAVPLALFELAINLSISNTGLFNILALPLWLNIILTIIVFDLLIYLQHVFFHKVNFFWRIHRLHHTDINYDVTTGVRFHPFEIVLSMLYKLLAVYLLGPAAIAIILYEILLSSAALFTHSNLKLNTKLDYYLRMIFVTPDMHRVHHSAVKYETDSNYGNLFSCWDRLFKTYRRQPEAGYQKMVIGLDEFRDKHSHQLFQLLKNPFFMSR